MLSKYTKIIVLVVHDCIPWLFQKNRSASRFLNKGIRATQFLEEMDTVIPREMIVDKIDEHIVSSRPEL